MALLALAGGAFWFLSRSEGRQASAPPQPPLVQAAPTEIADELVIRQTGFVRPRTQVSVNTQASGRIAEIGETFTLGGRVSSGDLLVRLDQARFRADVERAEARVQQAEASVAEAEIDRRRQEELEERDVASEANLQQAIVGVATADATLASARADLTQARQALSDTQVRAPFDGLVIEKDAAVGQLLQPGASVGRLVSADAAEIEMGLVAADLAILGDAANAIGGEVIVRGASGTVLARGVVTAVDPQIERQTRTTGLVISVADPFDAGAARPLRIDELVELELPVAFEGSSALRVPAQALKQGDIVWSIPNGRLSRHEALVLQRNENFAVVISSGLSPGTRVMLSDLAAAVEGKEVRVADQAAPPGPQEDAAGAATGIGGGPETARQQDRSGSAGAVGSSVWSRPGPASTGSTGEIDGSGPGLAASADGQRPGSEPVPDRDGPALGTLPRTGPEVEDRGGEGVGPGVGRAVEPGASRTTGGDTGVGGVNPAGRGVEATGGVDAGADGTQGIDGRGG